MKHYFEYFEAIVKSNWDSKALCNYKGEEFTFGELAATIEKFHIFFDKAGFAKGDKIALCAKNTARWAASFLSISTGERVVVPILADFLPENAAQLIAHSGAVALFVDPETFEKMDIATMPQVQIVLSNNDYSVLFAANEQIAAQYASMDADFAAAHPQGFCAENVHYTCANIDDIAVINYTSGTTSAPKGVMLTYRNISATVDFGVRWLPASPKDNIVSMLPMGHIYGMVYEFLYPVCSGVTVYYLGKSPSPSTLLKAMQEVKPYLVVTVPLVMEKVYKSNIKPVLSKPAMKVLLAIPGINSILYRVVGKKLVAAFGGQVQSFIMGGAALNPDVEAVFKKIKLPYLVGYGMTEAAPLLAYAPWREYVEGSCGVAVDCAQVRIDSEDPENVVGEIQAKGENICVGYYNNPEASENLYTEDGWLRTGDLGVIDKNGNIFIKGRSKNMILSANGQNIYPEEMEAVINSQDYIGESVVVDRNGKLVALIYIDPAMIKNAGLSEEAVAAIPENTRVAANKLLPAYSQIAKAEVVSEPFAKTPKMSIKRFMYK